MDGTDGGDSFETLYRQLEETVAGLEQGGLTLEQALARFEEGMRLVQRCTQLLNQAELRITRLLAEVDDPISDAEAGE